MAFSSFGAFLLRQFFLTIPKGSRAAFIDGASRLRSSRQYYCADVYRRSAALAFTFSWRNGPFLWPLIVASNSDMATIPLGLLLFKTQRAPRGTTSWPARPSRCCRHRARDPPAALHLQRHFDRLRLWRALRHMKGSRSKEITGIAHVAIKVRTSTDARWCGRVFRFREMMRLNNARRFTVPSPAHPSQQFLEVFPNAARTGPLDNDGNGINHFYFRVSDPDASACAHHRTRHPASLAFRPGDRRQPPVLDRGPDGNRIEIMEMDPQLPALPGREEPCARRKPVSATLSLQA